MKHYVESQWLALKNRKLSRPESEIMETHLLECEDCLNLFLRLTDELAAPPANNVIPRDFSCSTMTFIQDRVRSRSNYGRSRDKIKRLLSYYVAASVVTLVLAGGGFFTKVADRAMTLSDQPGIEARQPDSILFTWPNRLIETSSYWTEMIPKESKNLKEVIW
ncbi:MAG: hypothetical protein VB084_06550 [Syntrophomonadaceae bacterium]|nr:hypothetical protein [Syntrophomonadaceae bacterium]